jgi:hypothetical protein
LAAIYKSHDPLQPAKPNPALLPQRKTFKRRTSKEMAENRNRPISLLVERMMMMVMTR